MAESRTANISFTRREPSVTVNEAVFRLLGWREGDLRGADKQVFPTGVSYYGDSGAYSYGGGPSDDAGKEPVASPKTDSSRSADQSPLLLSLDERYSDVLSDRLYKAIGEYANASQSSATPEVLQEKSEAIAHCKAELGRAKGFKAAIVRELDRGGKSELRVDFQETISDGELRIYRSGLDRWAQEVFESSVFQSSEGSPSEGGIWGPSKNAKKIDYGSAYPVDKRNEEGGLNQKSVNSLFVTFASLVQLFAEEVGDRFGDAANPTVLAIAEQLSDRAIRIGKRGPLHGQGVERIMDRIEEAIEVKAYAMSRG